MVFRDAVGNLLPRGVFLHFGRVHCMGAQGSMYQDILVLNLIHDHNSALIHENWIARHDDSQIYVLVPDVNPLSEFADKMARI